jgi:hypothetical protein
MLKKSAIKKKFRAHVTDRYCIESSLAWPPHNKRVNVPELNTFVSHRSRLTEIQVLRRDVPERQLHFTNDGAKAHSYTILTHLTNVSTPTCFMGQLHSRLHRQIKLDRTTALTYKRLYVLSSKADPVKCRSLKLVYMPRKIYSICTSKMNVMET